MKIIIAPASFKGSLSNIEAALIIEKACLDVFPSAETVLFPLADGGEGTIDVVKKIAGGRLMQAEVHGPLFGKIKAKWLKQEGTAYIEMAQAAGLTLLSEKEKNPLETTTFGAGELIRRAVSFGCRDIFIGVGGSATNDGGIGALTALGAIFSRKNGSRIYPGCGKDLADIERIDVSGLMPELAESRFTILSDVKNPLYGKRGAAYLYGPQKGADKKVVELLDKGLRNYSRLIRKTAGIDAAHIPGTGAAGGFAGGFAAFLQAEIVSGIETLLEMGRVADKIQNADLLFTGEGRVDIQTLYGKAPGVVTRISEKHGVPVILFAGRAEKEICKKRIFKNALIAEISPENISVERAMKNAGKYLYGAAVKMLKSRLVKSTCF
ncbi:MAG: glycerate kinase [Candidatus Omnitrophica bacterium]|nr:glycerate kinase [Candidatus Omnitrophota bacterium]